MDGHKLFSHPIKLILTLTGLLGLVLAAVIALWGWNGRMFETQMIGGPFELSAGGGRKVTNNDFLGEPALVFFGFANCPDICPTTLYQISEIFGALGEKAKIRAVFITVDPERDSPESMKSFISSFDSRIIGLSGTPEAIEKAKRAYRIYAKKVPTASGNYTMDHTALVFLLNKEGRFVKIFDINRDAKTAAEELKSYL